MRAREPAYQGLPQILPSSVAASIRLETYLPLGGLATCSKAPSSANSGVHVVPISATSGVLPPAIEVVNLSCACAHGTNSMLTLVPGCWDSNDVPYALTTLWIFGEPGSMIHTSMEPDSFAGVDVLALSLLLLLSLPPQAASATLTAASAASNTFGVLTLPPRRPPPVGRGTSDWRPSPTRRPSPICCMLLTRPQRGPELGHEPIAITAIDGPDELHHLPSLARARPLEEEGRRVQGHAQHLGLLL